MIAKEKPVFSEVHVWIATFGGLIGIIVAIWTVALSDRAILVISDYHVEDPSIEFPQITKRFIFSFTIRNESDGPIIIRDLFLANSIFSPPENFKVLSAGERSDYINEYRSCSGITSGVGQRDWVPGKDLAVLEAGETHVTTADYYVVENSGSNSWSLPDSPVCLKASLIDQFGMHHNIAESIGTVNSGPGVKLESGVQLMNYHLEHKKHFYLLPKSKCIQIFSDPYCI